MECACFAIALAPLPLYHCLRTMPFSCGTTAPGGSQLLSITLIDHIEHIQSITKALAARRFNFVSILNFPVAISQSVFHVIVFSNYTPSSQMNIFYNLESLALSQTQRHSLSHEAFGLSVEVSDDETDMDHILLSICTK